MIEALGPAVMYLVSAEGDSSILAQGNALGIYWPPARALKVRLNWWTLSRAYSAWSDDIFIPGALPQAAIESAPLALNRHAVIPLSDALTTLNFFQ